jgi:hypothetical protein
MSELTLVHQKLKVTDVKLITVSEIVADNGEQVRIVKFYGDPIVSGAPTPFAEIECRSSLKANLEIQAPGFKF